MRANIKLIVDRAVAKISREMEISPALANLELLQCVLQSLRGCSNESLLDYCREVLKAKDQEMQP